MLGSRKKPKKSSGVICLSQREAATLKRIIWRRSEQKAANISLSAFQWTPRNAFNSYARQSKKEQNTGLHAKLNLHKECSVVHWSCLLEWKEKPSGTDSTAQVLESSALLWLSIRWPQTEHKVTKKKLRNLAERFAAWDFLTWSQSEKLWQSWLHWPNRTHCISEPPVRNFSYLLFKIRIQIAVGVLTIKDNYTSSCIMSWKWVTGSYSFMELKTVVN